MQTRFDWRALALAIASLAIAGLLTLPHLGTSETVALRSVPTNEGPTADAPGGFTPKPLPEQRCARDNVSPRYYYGADFAKKETPGAFGTAIDASEVSKANAEVRYRLCGDDMIGGDKALWRSYDAVVHHTDRNRSVSDGDWRREARNFVRAVQWGKSRIVEETTQPGMRTLYMADKNNDGVPEVEATTLRPREKTRFLILTVFNGVTTVELKIRLACGGQPVAEPGAISAAFS